MSSLFHPKNLYANDHLKINDKRGDPIETAAVVIRQIEDIPQAKFDVDKLRTAA